MTNNKITVQANGDSRIEPLKLTYNSSFYEQWDKNSDWQLVFDAYNDGTIAYQLLDVESTVTFNGQQYIVKQLEHDFNEGIESKEVTATHIYNEINRVYQRSVKTGTLTYTVNDVLSFYLDGNDEGFTYQVVGAFGSQQITDLGNSNGSDMLSKILDTWSNAVIYPDNKRIVVYSQDTFVQNKGGRLDYLHSSDDVNAITEIKLTYDSTSLSNTVMVYGATKDDDNSDSDTTEYYFTPHIVTDSESVAKYGTRPADDLSDDRFTIAANMDAYALTQLQGEPALTIEVDGDVRSRPTPGELMRLELRPAQLQTDVEIVGFQYYPFDSTGSSTITLNNTAKTILDYQRRSKNAINTATQNALLALTNEQSKKIADLESAVDALRNQSTTWESGSVFVDVSKWQTDTSVDWFATLKGLGATGAMVKLTESTDYTSETAQAQITNSKAAGLSLVGVYHFYGGGDPTAEANHFIAQLNAFNIPKTAIVALDVEGKKLSADKTTLTAQMAEFHKVVAAAGWTKTADYGSSSWFSSRFDHTATGAKYSWIAAWSDSMSNKPANADAWQFSDNWNGLNVDASYSYNQAFI